ncbi:PEP/pyruvate-binding domain-containing protein [Arthrobacter sp. Soil764]|uniref:PEP/pyruvate-binding domain-containing protein n=1 Tax=Arthrobacter sp. Soil764 TaxID=1736403 RepID=UPI0006F6060E|nr:PEP/pyruvate-binding domain-containing protein [Arthrobacter sp. Soil764]KRE82236.1 phosphoenolpyruvate synthase [Arthrobacter sp. Soil764]
MEQAGLRTAGTGTDAGLVLDLRRLNAGMLPLAGGKAANLGELLSAGLPVPDGFCLTTDAYRQALGVPGSLPPALAAVHAAFVESAPAARRDAAQTRAAEPPDIAGLAGAARAAIRATPIPAAVSQAVEEAYAALGPDVPVAVRSSATAEDLPFASFAGQQDTYLNVIGVPALLEAVRNCWASLWTDRATAYRASLGIDPAGVALAVVVQRMVDADAAGVMFTANPLTGRRRQIVIDASPGLGEAVVSGAVNPDHFVVDALSGKVLERTLGDKGVEVRPLPGGGTQTRNVSSATGAACLTDWHIAGLARLGLQAEDHFGAPQDTEWAIDRSGGMWLTQSRPITTLYPVPRSNGAAGRIPEGRSATRGTRAYLCFSLAQGLTRPLTPMGLAAVRLIASSIATAAGFPVPDPRGGPSPYAEAGQRIYVDFTTPIRSTAGRWLVPRVFDIMEARTATVMRQLFEDPAFSVITKSPFGLLRHVAPAAARAKVPGTFLRALFRPAAALRRLDRFTQDFEASLHFGGGEGAVARLDHVELLLRRRLFPIVPAILPLPAVGFAMLGVAGKLLGGNAWDELQPVIRGLPNNVTTEMDLELWHLAREIREDRESRDALMTGDPNVLAAAFQAGQLPPRLDAGLARFLDRYGHRAVAEIDVGLPRWSEEPAHILGILANYLRLEDPALAPDAQFSKAIEDAEAQVDLLVARAAARGRIRGRLVRAALHRARLLAGLRELPKYQLVAGLAEVRRELLLVGSELAQAGTIERQDDVFFLDFAEARKALSGVPLSGTAAANGVAVQDFRALVASRRQDYAQELRRRHIPRVLLSDGTEPEAVRTGVGISAEGTLTGSPASAGTVTAAARVILDPVGARLEPGEILVAPSTDPGWTPLFLTAGGLVMEMGGANSHGAVVAREYGIPAVVGVADATGLISTGQKITVDGGAGTVVPEPPGPAVQDGGAAGGPHPPAPA